MAGRSVLITGATNGIGLVAATQIARQGARVTVVGRDAAKTERVAGELRRAAPEGAVDYLLADLSSLDEVRRLAREVGARHERLDVLLNNAGAMFTRRHVTADGYERTFALNHLAPFLLTRELLPWLERSAAARVVNVASGAHQRGTIRFDDLMLERRYTPWAAYCQSKLANVLFTRELARRLEGTSVTTNSVHPGFVRTGFGKNDGVLTRLAISLGMLVARSPERGAETLVWLATAPQVAEESGKYWVDRQERRPSREGRDDGVARRLWEVSEALVSR
jgi:NAD(P)-dependent dehydrogenase (short-subunit alcohol dehydrogenase family)